MLPMETTKFLELVWRNAVNPDRLWALRTRHHPMPDHLSLFNGSWRQGYNIPAGVIPEYRISPGPDSFIHKEGWRVLLEKLAAARVIRDTAEIRKLRGEHQWTSRGWE